MKLLLFLGYLLSGLWAFLIEIPFCVGARRASGEVDQPQEKSAINLTLDVLGLVLWVCLCTVLGALFIWWLVTRLTGL
jgi:hypothetical protein